MFGSLTFISTALAQSKHNNTASTEAVTSSYDAVIKAVLIISQLAIAGLVLNEILFMYLKRKVTKLSNKDDKSSWTSHVQVSGRFLKLIILFSIVMAAASTTILLVQLFDLEQELGIDITTASEVIISTSVGGVWITRIATSAIIILLAVIYHIFLNRTKNNKNDATKSRFLREKSLKSIRYIFLSVFVLFILISLYSNSMISHSNALSSFSELAVFVDWVHLTAVAIWIGGLFYIFTIILKDGKISKDSKIVINTQVYLNKDNENDRQSMVVNFMMNFSYVAIVSLIIIGITGLILGRIHLQNISSLFLTTYGNILILKICLTLPMIILGKYNQDKVEKLSHLKINPEEILEDIKDSKNIIFKKINRSIKAELLLGIIIVIVASFLSVTSPLRFQLLIKVTIRQM